MCVSWPCLSPFARKDRHQFAGPFVNPTCFCLPKSSFRVSLRVLFDKRKKGGCLVREKLLFSLPASSLVVCCVWWLGVAVAIDLSLYFPLFPKQKLLKQKLRWSSSPRTKSQLPTTQGKGMAKNKNAKETNNRDTRIGSKLSHERRSPESLRPEKRRVFVLSSILN